MVVNGNYGTYVMQRKVDEIYQDEFKKTSLDLPQSNGLNPTYTTGNKWVGYIPIQNILGKKWNNLELNLTRFSIPQMEMGSASTSFKGYEYYIPTKVMDGGSKEINFDYIIDQNWYNYKSLYAWMSGLRGNINEVYKTNDTGVSIKDTLDVRVWLIDSFKNRILDLCFYDSWIRIFQNVQLESASTDPVTHGFTLCYSHYEIMDIKP